MATLSKIRGPTRATATALLAVRVATRPLTCSRVPAGGIQFKLALVPARADRRGFSTSPISRSANAPAKSRVLSKVFKNADDAVADIPSGAVLLSSGFGLCGVAGETRDIPLVQSLDRDKFD